MMQFVLITHDVDNYKEWKEGFDKASKIRKIAGEIKYQVLVYEKQPNRVIHLSQWQSHEQAKAFFESDAVKLIRKKLGVKRPLFNYIHQLEEGIL